MTENKYCCTEKPVLYLPETRYGVRDPEILAAIRWHITGRPEMGLLEQILFVADYTEPGREGAVFDLVRETLRKGPCAGGACRVREHHTICYKWEGQAALYANGADEKLGFKENC